MVSKTKLTINPVGKLSPVAKTDSGSCQVQVDQQNGASCLCMQRPCKGLSNEIVRDTVRKRSSSDDTIRPNGSLQGGPDRWWAKVKPPPLRFRLTQIKLGIHSVAGQRRRADQGTLKVSS